MTTATMGPEIAIDVAADDNATATLTRLRATMASLSGPIQGVTSAISKIAERGNFQAIANQVGRVGGAFSNLASQATRVVAPVAAIGGALSLGGVGASVQGFIQRTGELADASARLGVSVEDLQEFRYAAGLVGVEAGEMDSALERLNKGIAEVADGKNADLGALLSRMGISVRDASGEVRSAADLMPQLAQAFEKNGNAALRTRMAMELFGKSGASLVPLLSQGAKAMEESREEARRLGVMNEDAVKAGDDLGDGFQRLGTAIQGMADAIGTRLAPVLTPMVEDLTKWIAANREIVGAKVAEVVERLGTAIGKVDFSAFFDRVQELAGKVDEIVQKFGGWERAVIALGVALNASLVAALVAVGAQIITLGALVASNPVAAGAVAVAAAIGAMAAAIYTNFGGVADWLDAQLKRVMSILDLLAEGVRRSVGEISELFSTIRNAVGGGLDAAANLASRAGGAVANAFGLGPSPEDAAAAAGRSVTVPVMRIGEPTRGTVDVRVTVDGPRGTKVETKESGDVDTTTRQNLGYQGGW